MLRSSRALIDLFPILQSFHVSYGSHSSSTMTDTVFFTYSLANILILKILFYNLNLLLVFVETKEVLIESFVTLPIAETVWIGNR